MTNAAQPEIRPVSMKQNREANLDKSLVADFVRDDVVHHPVTEPASQEILPLAGVAHGADQAVFRGHRPFFRLEEVDGRKSHRLHRPAEFVERDAGTGPVGDRLGERRATRDERRGLGTERWALSAERDGGGGQRLDRGASVHG